MAFRLYLVPVETNPINGGRGPKYFPYRNDPDPPALIQTADDGQNIFFDSSRYGDEPQMLIAAYVSDADDATLAALPDVVKFADDLDSVVGDAALPGLQAALNALNIPGNLVTASTTWRLVARGIIGVFSIGICMQGKKRNIFAGGVTLATTMNQIPAAPRADLQACCTSLGYDISSVTGSTTVRQLLVTIANQTSPRTLLDVVI
jgi:hypothetical protein